MELKTVLQSTARFGVAVLAVALLVGGVSQYVRYRRDLTAARSRLSALGSRVVQTACGPIEYAEAAEGYPALVVHGLVGGYDQGLLLARGQLGEGLRAIAPARFGYFGTPLPAAASPASQADSHACLLDALNVQRAVVLATSAGSTSALQFALRHPERVAALVLVSPNAPSEVDVQLPPSGVARAMFSSDLAFWGLSTYFRGRLASMMGVPAGWVLTPADEAAITTTIDTLLPVSPRTEGVLFDMFTGNADINCGYPLDQIRVPVLVVGARDDPLALFANTEALAAQIPGAQLVAVPDGGHMLLGREAEVRQAIEQFLFEHTAVNAVR